LRHQRLGISTCDQDAKEIIKHLDTPKSLHASSSLKRGVSLDSSNIFYGCCCAENFRNLEKFSCFGSAQDLANPFGSGFAGPENSNLRILSEPEHAQDFTRVLDIRLLDVQHIT